MRLGAAAETAADAAQHLVDRRALLGAGRKVQAAQVRIQLFAGRLEDAVEEMNNSPLQRAQLCRKAEDGNARDRIGLLLEAVRHLLGQAFYQRIEFGRSLADHVLAAIRSLERRAPYLASACFIETAESTP